MQALNWNTSVKFEVPGLTPPSVNHIYKPATNRRSGRMKFILVPEVHAFRDAVAIYSRGLTVVPDNKRELRKVRYRVEVDVYLGHGARLDADNAGKTCLDSLVKAGVINSDAFVESCVLNIHKDERDAPR